jgi:hypothetical protein
LNIDNFTERDPAGSQIAADVCIHNPENINIYEPVPEGAHYSLVVLLQQYGLKLVNLHNVVL